MIWIAGSVSDGRRAAVALTSSPAPSSAAQRGLPGWHWHRSAIHGQTQGEPVMALYRSWLDQHGLVTSATLEACDDGQRVKLAGLCIVHQAPPTAKGFHFLCLEDAWGMANVIASPGLVICDGKHLQGGRVLLVDGVVQREGDVVNLLAQRVGPLAAG